MLGALLIVFREVLEAGLIIGIVSASVHNKSEVRPWIWAGLAAGIAGSILVGFFTGYISTLFEGFGQEYFNAAVLGTAVIMLMWHNGWMANHARHMATELRHAGRAADTDQKARLALATIVGLSVLREGSEVALFLYGIAASGGVSGGSMLAGSLAGLGLGALLSLAVFYGISHIPLRHFFNATNLLIAFLAAGLAAQAVGYLHAAGAVTALSTPLWNSSDILPEGGIAGTLLHTLIGYDDRPSGMQLAAWLTVVLIMIAMPRWMNGKSHLASA